MSRNRVSAILSIVIVTLALALAAIGVTSATGPDPTPLTQALQRTCTTDASGYCTVTHTLGAVPEAVVVTPVISAGWLDYHLSVVTGSATATSVRVRAMRTDTSPRANLPITFSLVVYGSAPAPTTTVPPTTTTAVPTTTPPVTTTTVTPPPPSGFPTPASTGVPDGTVFTRSMGYYEARTAGETFDRVHFTSAVLVTAPGVVITNSQVDDTVVVEGSGSLTITDSTIGPELCGTPNWYAAALNGANYTATRVEVRGHEDDFNAGGPDITIRDSYAKNCGSADAHADGVQDYPRAERLVVDHNTFDLRGVDGQNAAVFVHANPVSTDVIITRNLAMGGAFTYYLWPGDGTWTVTGNRAVDRTTGTYGPYETEGRCSEVDSWSDNDVVTIDGNYQITATVRDDVACDAGSRW
jgi:hypothetical protein